MHENSFNYKSPETIQIMQTLFAPQEVYQPTFQIETANPLRFSPSAVCSLQNPRQLRTNLLKL